MSLEEFKSTLNEASIPATLTNNLRAMWFDAQGDWKKAHEVAQDLHSQEGAWIHAYLHRKEGDDGNASYWYHRATRKMPSYTLQEEWDEITTFFLQNSPG